MFDSVVMVASLGQEVSSWSTDQLAAGLRQLATLRAAVEACEAHVLAAFVTSKGHEGTGAPDAPTWVRAQTGASHREAARRVGLARDLAAVPSAAEALAAGRLTVEHAGALARAARQHPEVRARADELVQVAAEQPADAFERTLRSWIAEHRTTDGAAELERQRANRRVSSFTADDGMVGLDVRLDPVAGATVLGALDRLAEQLWRADAPGGIGAGARAATLTQRRADALVQLCSTGGGDSRAQPTVVVLVDHQTLLGELVEHPTSRLLDGTPLAAETARRLACDAKLLPVVLDGAGVPLDLGRSRRMPSQAQRTALAVRDGGCLFPGSDRPPGWCDAHHLVPWDVEGGPTDLANLVMLCEAHHHHVHEGGWRLHRETDAGITATSASGAVLHRRAPPRRAPAAPSVRACGQLALVGPGP